MPIPDSTKPDNPPAFPRLGSLVTHDQNADHTKRYTAESVGGMSLRDYFAAQALAGLLADGALATAINQEHGSINEGCRRLSHGCYTVADAMLAARAEAK